MIINSRSIWLRLFSEEAMEELGAWLAALDWRPLFISLKTGIIATVISFFLGIFAAWKIARMKNRWACGY